MALLVIKFLLQTRQTVIIPPAIKTRPKVSEKQRIDFFVGHQNRFEVLRKMFTDQAKSEKFDFTHLDLKNRADSKAILAELNLVGGTYRQKQRLLVVTSLPEDSSGTDGYAYSSVSLKASDDEAEEFKSIKSGWYLYHRR